MCEEGLAYFSWDIITYCVTSNHQNCEIPNHSFCFVIFCHASLLVFYVLGLDSCVIANELVSSITKSLPSGFCATTRFKLF